MSTGALRFEIDRPLPRELVEKLIAVPLRQAFPEQERVDYTSSTLKRTDNFAATSRTAEGWSASVASIALLAPERRIQIGAWRLRNASGVLPPADGHGPLRLPRS